MVKNKSKLQLKNKILKIISLYENIDNIILFFGKVDIKIKYYYKLIYENINIDFDKYYKKTVNNYIKFIKTIPQKYHKKIIVLSVYHPNVYNKYFKICLKNYICPYSDKKYNCLKKIDSFFKNKKNKVYIDKFNRLSNIIKFNKLLKKKLKKINIHFFDINKYITNDKNIIKKKYNIGYPWSIHLSWEKLIVIYLKKLYKKNYIKKITLNKKFIDDKKKEYMIWKKKEYNDRLKSKFYGKFYIKDILF